MAAPRTPVGAKSDKIWRNAIMRAVKRRDSGEDPQALEKLADKVVTEGLDGNMAALKEIGDRLDGRPAQSVAMTVDDKRSRDEDIARATELIDGLGTGGSGDGAGGGEGEGGGGESD